MEEVIRQAADPVVNYTFGGFCILLMGVIGALLWFGRKVMLLWRADVKEAVAQYVGLSTAATTAIEKNAAANVLLSKSLDELRRQLIDRPCLQNGE